jgi:hypothetical protein
MFYRKIPTSGEELPVIGWVLGDTSGLPRFLLMVERKARQSIA